MAKNLGTFCFGTIYQKLVFFMKQIGFFSLCVCFQFGICVYSYARRIGMLMYSFIKKENKADCKMMLSIKFLSLIWPNGYCKKLYFCNDAAKSKLFRFQCMFWVEASHFVTQFLLFCHSFWTINPKWKSCCHQILNPRHQNRNAYRATALT